MSSWFSQGFDEAEKLATQARTSRKRQRNVWAKKSEEFTLRFFKPARDSFNYKRCFVPKAKGQKLFTSPGVQPDPFQEAGYNLQAAFAWPVIDRRIFEIEVEEDGKKITKSVGPSIRYFADGSMVRKALIALENSFRKEINEERIEEGKEPLTEDEYNLTHFDIKATKLDKGWQFIPARGGKPKPLSKEDKDLVEKQPIDLLEELKPLPVEEIRRVLGSAEEPTKETTEYSYGNDNSDEPTFFE